MVGEILDADLARTAKGNELCHILLLLLLGIASLRLGLGATIECKLGEDHIVLVRSLGQFEAYA